MLQLKAPNTEDLEIASKLRSLRQLRGMSLQYVGDNVGITPQQIQRYESGKNRVAAGTLNRLANLYGMSGSHFFGDLAQPEESFTKILKLVGNADTRQLVEAFSTIEKPALRRAVLAIVKMAAETARCADARPTTRRAARDTATPQAILSTQEK